IRTQPHDILQWSAAYFSALSKEDTLPCPKETLCPLQRRHYALSKGDTLPCLLKVLHKQLALKETISKEEKQQKRKCLCLPSEQLDTLLALGNFNDNIHRMHFFPLGGAIISALRYVCEILTGNEMGLYTYLAHLDGEIPHSARSKSRSQTLTFNLHASRWPALLCSLDHNSSQFNLRGFIGMGNIAKAREIDQQKGYKQLKN
uniref:RIIa domain-containing protein n=1 Tax=Oncorhynchus mykiss TaxID=8022 RepID=A0A8K9X021_ONCMY